MSSKAHPPRAGPSQNASLQGLQESAAQFGSSESPLIPFTILDAPSQRFYLSAAYLALTAWRLYDYFKLISEQSDSLWLFMKWVLIDGIFLYTLPELKVPWMSWSFTTTTLIFLCHATTTAILMFRIPVRPVQLQMKRPGQRLGATLTSCIDTTRGLDFRLDQDAVRQGNCGF